MYIACHRQTHTKVRFHNPRLVLKTSDFLDKSKSMGDECNSLRVINPLQIGCVYAVVIPIADKSLKQSDTSHW